MALCRCVRKASVHVLESRTLRWQPLNWPMFDMETITIIIIMTGAATMSQHVGIYTRKAEAKPIMAAAAMMASNV